MERKAGGKEAAGGHATISRRPPRGFRGLRSCGHLNRFLVFSGAHVQIQVFPGIVSVGLAAPPAHSAGCEDQRIDLVWRINALL